MALLLHLARQQFLGLAALILVLGGIANAATGGRFILGGDNSAGKTSALTNTGTGAALSLNVQSGQPPLAVNSSKVVAGLNAQRLGGHFAKDFAPAVGSPSYLSSSGPQVLATAQFGTPAEGI